MNYPSRIVLSCWLANTATTVIAAGSTADYWTISGKPYAIFQALPSVQFTVRAPLKKSHQPLLIEGFWPLMQQEHLLLFLQGSRQRQEQHTVLNLGMGWRYFPEIRWGVGYNLFYDQDITRQQRRLGLGAEAWLHSLTLAVNSYFPVNDWQTAHDSRDYQRRPARSYDVTLQGHLPNLPHLGASLHYARYVGNEVAWGIKRPCYRNPQQWRWGIDITPIPLITLAYHQHVGFRAQAKQQFSVVLTYRFSLSLSQQLDANQVTKLHSAEGQRLATVQREQVMVLNYAALNHDKAPALEEAVKLEEMKQETNNQEEDKTEQSIEVRQPTISELLWDDYQEIKSIIDEDEGS